MSTYKKLVFGDDARDKIAQGVNTLASAVKVTMGPSGQNVVIERPGRPPHLTKDGVTVAHAINLSDRYMNLGAQMVKEAAQRAAEIAGDGTTTATVLAQSMYTNGLRMIAAGFDPTEICRGIQAASRKIEQEVNELSAAIECDEDIVHVGTISANGDVSIGELLCEAVKSVGKDGSIAVEEAKGFDTSLDIVEGTQIERGYLSPYFVTNQDRMVAEFSNPYVFLVNKKLSNIISYDCLGFSFLERYKKAKDSIYLQAICSNKGFGDKILKITELMSEFMLFNKMYLSAVDTALAYYISRNYEIIINRKKGRNLKYIVDPNSSKYIKEPIKGSKELYGYRGSEMFRTVQKRSKKGNRNNTRDLSSVRRSSRTKKRVNESTYPKQFILQNVSFDDDDNINMVKEMKEFRETTE